jgi:glycosyltransferase involved in cell wall biosynthesis
MRIAFITPEYPSELADRGGLGTYLHRMARLLAETGHQPEVFVATDQQPGVITYEGIRVQRVSWTQEYTWTRRCHRAGTITLRSRLWDLLPWLLRAHSLSVALEERHSMAPFQLVQSADYLASGLFVRQRPERVHIVRCSSSADLYSAADRAESALSSCRGILERLSMRRADLCYAPSQLLAEHFLRRHNIHVSVIRPPSYMEIPTLPPPPDGLPQRFFIHFGQLMERKGTDLLAQALPIAWQTVPDLVMVWSGRCWDMRKIARWQSLWGDRASQVQITGPLPRATLYAALKRADVAILPSQVDNLPNTVIESLMFGIPVVGSQGASIDELVEEDRTGHLVPLGDVRSLASALVRMWLKQTPVKKGFVWNSKIAQEMVPQRAVANLISAARISKGRRLPPPPASVPLGQREVRNI